jgi:hypothetical protein
VVPNRPAIKVETFVEYLPHLLVIQPSHRFWPCSKIGSSPSAAAEGHDSALGKAQQMESTMNNGRNNCQRISRRVLLSGTVLVLGAAAATTAASQATAQEKMAQADAKYQGTPKDDQRCDGCTLFQPPNACKVVQGEISPSGWCQLFVKKA